MDVLDLHLHQPSPLPRLRRLWNRKAAAAESQPESLGEAGAELGELFEPKQWSAVVDEVWE
jgi:hypothetical protein